MRKNIIFTVILTILTAMIALSCKAQKETLPPNIPSVTTPAVTLQPTESKTISSSLTTPVSVIPSRTYEEAPVILTKQSDGQIVHVNLVKFIGFSLNAKYKGVG